MTLYYHISTDLEHDGTFTPRIPTTRADNEDFSSPRICVSRTIEGAVSAIPNGGSRLDELIEHNHGFLKLFVFDSEDLDLNDDNMIDCDTLYEKGLVHDATITDEYWIMKPVKVPETHQYVIIPQDWGESIHDVIPYDILLLSDTDEYQGDIESAHYDMTNEMLGNILAIVDFKYDTTKLEKEQSIDLIHYDEVFLDDWKDIIAKLSVPVEVTLGEYGNVVLTALDSVDVTRCILEMQLRNLW